MKSENVYLVLVCGAVLASWLHHGKVYRDEYASREECENDWTSERSQCEAVTETGDYGYGTRIVYRGPPYEEGARPQTRKPQTRNNVVVVKQGGFGSSGARFTRGG